MTTMQAEALEDAGLALMDLSLVTAGLTEIRELIEAGHLTAFAVTDVAADVFPRLRALAAYVNELCVDVTA